MSKHKIEFENGRIAHLDKMNPYELNEAENRFGCSISKVNGESMSKAEHGTKTGYIRTMVGYKNPMYIYKVFDSWTGKKMTKTGSQYTGYKRTAELLEYATPNQYTSNFAPLNWVDNKGRRYFETFSDYFDNDEGGNEWGHSTSYYFFPESQFTKAEAEKLIKAKHPSNHSFNLDKHPDLYKFGSMVPDHYEWVELENLYPNFESDEKLWQTWSLKQRHHFLRDHFQVEMSKAKGETELQKFWWQIEDTARLDYDKLPELVKMELKDHKKAGQYKAGGSVNTFHEGEKVKVKGVSGTIVRYDKPSGAYVVYTGKYESEFIQPEDITKIAKHGAILDKDQTDMFAETPANEKYRAEVGAVGENKWSGNAMEYDTPEEAKDWLRGLSMRWFGYNIARVVPVSTPTNQTIDANDSTIFQNFRSKEYEYGGNIEYDRDSQAFWVSRHNGPGQIAFDTKDEAIAYESGKINNPVENAGETNKQMVINTNHMIEHHTGELDKAVKKSSDVPPWVVAKAFRSATDISDITHFLEGESKSVSKAKQGAIAGQKFRVKLSSTSNAKPEQIVNGYLGNSFGNGQIEVYTRGEAIKKAKSFNGKIEAIETKIAKRGAKTGSKGFMVFNYTDEIYASPDTFPTKAKANEFIANFRKRFEAQGYYRDNRQNKIDIKHIDLLAIPSDFSPFK